MQEPERQQMSFFDRQRAVGGNTQFVSMNKLSLLLLAFCGALVGCVSAADKADDSGWVNLFNGKDLDGWVQHGGKARYRFEDGQLIGTCVSNTPNSFLCSSRDYTNFILEVDFKTPTGLNSGVQIRSHVYDKPTEFEWKGEKKKIPADRVHGLQVEIDPSDRAWSGGIYEEGRRGWLNDLKANEQARKAYKKEEWNHYRIEAKGDSIKTWINGVPAADLKDSLAMSGIIAFQVHGVGKRAEVLEVRFRNARLKELP